MDGSRRNVRTSPTPWRPFAFPLRRASDHEKCEHFRWEWQGDARASPRDRGGNRTLDLVTFSDALCTLSYTVDALYVGPTRYGLPEHGAGLTSLCVLLCRFCGGEIRPGACEIPLASLHVVACASIRLVLVADPVTRLLGVLERSLGSANVVFCTTSSCCLIGQSNHFLFRWVSHGPVDRN